MKHRQKIEMFEDLVRAHERINTVRSIVAGGGLPDSKVINREIERAATMIAMAVNSLRSEINNPTRRS